ncbi:hypothetical protein Sliba_77800 [Streptomyces nigrescens]|uniref:Uncharacterized protein n=1 Tax=Streptomyces nigrescens TaxID=1920 RepID=A0A640TUI7_STRNI|nr:hypothetical protein Sliba_77800 [Streptomyces libani subsp. libani]GGV96452.1 hypothetical protein GCM10010500_39270 [Streptomyces libani subsp. libani]
MATATEKLAPAGRAASSWAKRRLADFGRRTGRPAAGRAVLVVGVGAADDREGVGTGGDGDDAGPGRRGLAEAEWGFIHPPPETGEGSMAPGLRELGDPRYPTLGPDCLRHDVGLSHIVQELTRKGIDTSRVGRVGRRRWFMPCPGSAGHGSAWLLRGLRGR